MNPDFYPNCSNNNAQPETVQDFIKLLTAVKEKYGNLKVRRCTDDYVNDPEEYYHFTDIVVNQPPQSLINNHNNYENQVPYDDSYLVFVVG